MNTTLNQNRSLNLFIAVGLAVAFLAAIMLASPASIDGPAVPQNAAEDQSPIALAPLAADAFPAYRESEWHSSLVTGVDGVDIYRLSERTLVDPFAEYLASERTLSPIMSADLTSYHLSERTMTEAIAINDLSQYFASEHILIDPLAGLATYFESERTMISMPFTQYQLSEWFGK